jgi:DNA adenine methylase
MKTLQIKRPVLRYHGGKYKLAKWIISNFPQHRIYTESMGGGGSVLMQKPRSYAEVYNDKWDTVVNVFKVLRDKDAAAKLEEQLRLTPFSRTEFNQCGEIDLIQIKDPIELARRTILRSLCGFGPASTNAKHSTGFRSNSNRSGTTPAHDWINYPDQIKTFVERLQGVVIENKHYKDILLQHDGPDTLHYLDPPYVHSTRNMQRSNSAYACEFSDDDHREMADVVKALQGMVIISGYDCDLYKELFGDWCKTSREAFADGAAKRIECLWVNQAALRKRQSMF